MFEERQRIIRWLPFGERADPTAQRRQITKLDIVNPVTMENQGQREGLNERGGVRPQRIAYGAHRAVLSSYRRAVNAVNMERSSRRRINRV
jgi:hypothetical protein